ncbi:MMPL family transporter [Nocardia takedensis]|uniref:MMPL family transporter n=1 Tax=Nocardia takedensis TaxID=259390 RepID=UPI000306BFC5|nr:MMPL family transporter [Nocardia takedensis]
MFTYWGDLVHRLRFAVLGLVTAGLLALGAYGAGLGDHLGSGGLDDPGSDSTRAAQLIGAGFALNHDVDVVVLYTAPTGSTVDDPDFAAAIVGNLNGLPERHPGRITGVNGAYWPTRTGKSSGPPFATADRRHAVATIALRGDNDDDLLRNYREVRGAFDIPGVDVRVGGLRPVANALNDTMAEDIRRMETLAFPVVAVLLFVVFGGLVAAALPLIVGGLTMIGANGIIRFATGYVEVNSFVAPVISMIGLGLAIDYGLFIVSRFREELADGHDTPAAVRRTVMTAGRTVVFSATMIVASAGGMLLFPQGFLRSIAYGAISAVSLAALTAVTILPALLAVLGPRVDTGGFAKLRRIRTAEEIERSFWGTAAQWVMRHPAKIAVTLCVGLALLILPVQNLAFGGYSERYLPPDNSTRLAQQHIDTLFPVRRSDPIELVFVSADSIAVGAAWKQANDAPGLSAAFDVPQRSGTRPDIYRTRALLADSDRAEATIDYLRSIETPDGVGMFVGGVPAVEKDSLDALADRLPLMIALVLLVTTLLMFLTFGSLILPIKAALTSALGLGSTLGILTWIFIDGHGAGPLNFTPQPIQANVLVLILALIYGLSTDYEVFLISRMVEARARGASTADAIRIGTAQTGRIITAAALILLVVTGAFAFSDLVLMQYIAYGMIAALLIDATVLRLLLVPASMKLLGDLCWWAPDWMKRIHRRVGASEFLLEDERPSAASTLVGAGR